MMMMMGGMMNLGRMWSRAGPGPSLYQHDPAFFEEQYCFPSVSDNSFPLMRTDFDNNTRSPMTVLCTRLRKVVCRLKKIP